MKHTKTNWDLLISAAQKKLSIGTWEVRGLDLIIYILIVAGYDQLVDSFGPQFFSSYLKAAGIEGGVIILSRLYSRFEQDFMRKALFLALALSFYANTTSEWIKVTGEQYLNDEVFAKLGWYQGIRAICVAGFIPYFIWILTKTRISCLADMVMAQNEITGLIKSKEKAEAQTNQGRRTRLRAKLREAGVDLTNVEDIEAEAARLGLSIVGAN